MLQFLSLKRFVPEPVITSLPVDATEPATEAATEAADAPVAMPRECGWFDSSFELRLGLVVQELPGFGPAWQVASPAPMH